MKKFIFFFLFSVCFYQTKAQIEQQSDWQQQVSYTIDVELDDENHKLLGKLKLVYTNNSPNSLDYIYFHLWPNAYSSDNTAFARQQLGNNKSEFHYSKPNERGSITDLEFKANDQPLLWSYDKKHRDIAKVNLAEALKPGEQITIETPFTVNIPKVFSRLGHDGQDYYMTQWYPKPAVYDVNGWNPIPYLDQGEFYSEFGDFTVNVTLPDNYVVAATGDLQSNEELELWEQRKDYPLKLDKDSVPPSSLEMKTVSFTASNVHDFAWFASKKFNVLESSVEINGATIQTRVFSYQPKDLHLTHIATALNFYSEEVGEYPYSHATVVEGELKAGGGMEYPMITLCDIMSEEVIVHEVGHNWFYGILASNERSYPWMDESINSFYDAKATAADEDNFLTKGLQAMFSNVIVKNNIVLNKHQSPSEHSADYTTMNYGMSVYHEGARAFGYLHAYLGDSMFKAAMHTYFDTWQYKHPLPKDMQNVFELVTKEDLNWFFQGVLKSSKGLDFSIKSKNNGFLLTNKGALTAPIPVENFYQIKKAEVLLNKKEIKPAIKILEEARAIEPNNSEIAKLLGDCYSFSMQYKRAVDFYHIALKDDFEADEVLLQLLKLHFILNKPEKAVSYLNHFSKGLYLSDAVLPEIIKLLTDFKQTEKAVDFLRQIIHNDPYSYSSWYFLGYCFQKMEQFDSAIDAFEYCIAIDESNSMGHLGKGNSLVELKRYEEAITFYKQALDNDITDAEVYCNIAECYEHLDNLNSAKYHYLKALKLDKQLPDAYYGLGLIYKKQGRYPESEKNFLKAIDLDSYECLFHIELGELYLLMDKKERCFYHYEKAVEIDPITPEISLDYSQALVHFDELEHAVSLLKERLEKEDSDHRFLYRISSYLFHLGMYESAYTFLHKALEISPKQYLLLYEYAPFVENNVHVTNIIDLYI